MKKIFSILMAVLFVGSMYAADVTDTIAMKGFAGITTNSYQNQTKSGVSAKGVDMVAYAYNGSTGQVRGNKTAVAGASVTADDDSKNWSLYNSAAMPGTIKSIKVTQAATGTPKFQNKLYVSLGTATQGDVTAITSAQAQDDGATENEINFTIDANKKYTYFKLLTNTKFTGGSVADVKVMVTYEAAAPEPTTKTVYCKMTYSWWTDGSAAVGAYAWKEGGEAKNADWPGVKMSAVEGQMGVWTIDLDTTKYDKVIFTRLKGDGTEYWGAKTDDQLIPSDDKDLFTITSSDAQWDNDGKKAAGTWSKYVPETPAKFYIVGDSALVTDAGFAGKAWNPDAIKSETDTFTMNLKAGVDYQLKITTDGTWGTVKGYNKLTKVAAGLKDLDGDNHNIGFKLNEAGDVQVIYKDGETPVFKLVGNFVVEIPHYFIAGTMTNWKDEMVELLPLEEKADSLGVALNLKADSLYLYKIVRVQGTDTAWYGLDGDATMEYGNSTGWYIYKSEGEKNQKNVGLQTTKEAVYPFVLKVREDHLEVSVTIPARYYAKYAPNWEWAQLIEKEGKWLTDTIVYAGIGVNINVKASDEGNMFFSNTVEEEGVRPIAGDEIAELDTVQFSFNPVDTTLTVSLISKYVAPAIHYYVAGTMTNWKDEMVELLPLEEKADSLGVALNLKADSLYLYKIVRVQGTDTAWYGLDGDATMEYGNSTGWWIYKSEGEKNQKNVGLQTTKEGDYPVTLVIKEDQLIVSVVIPKPDTKYYAKYADKAGEWNWKLLTEKEGKWLTDTIVYYGGGMNIHSAAEGDGKYFAEIAGVAAKDTAYFSFNPEDSTLVATVVGAYVVPIAEDGYYLVGTFNDWTPSAAYMFVANELKPGEFVLTTTLAVDDEFKVIKSEGGNFTWYPAEGDNFVVMACYAGEKTMYFNPIVQDGWSLLGGHLYMEYTFKPGYYLVGSMTSWLPKEQYWFGDYMVSEEYQLETVLEEGWQIKVAKLEGNGEVYEYFPDGEGTHYTVDAAHAGAVIVYFRNLGYTEWAAFGGYIYIQPKSPSDIENTTVDGAAVKILRDGQILIIKGEKTYNALGILVE